MGRWTVYICAFLQELFKNICHFFNTRLSQDLSIVQGSRGPVVRTCPLSKIVVAEYLRRQTRNVLGSILAGSKPAGYVGKMSLWWWGWSSLVKLSTADVEVGCWNQSSSCLLYKRCNGSSIFLNKRWHQVSIQKHCPDRVFKEAPYI